MSGQLKQCPFCGGEPLMVHAVLEEYHSVNPEIICRECGYSIKAKNLAIAIADSPKASCDFMDKQVIVVWNLRPAEDAKDKKIARLRLQNMNLKKFIMEDLFHVMERYLPKKQVFSEIIGLLKLKYDRITGKCANNTKK